MHLPFMMSDALHIFCAVSNTRAQRGLLLDAVAVRTKSRTVKYIAHKAVYYATPVGLTMRLGHCIRHTCKRHSAVRTLPRCFMLPPRARRPRIWAQATVMWGI